MGQMAIGKKPAKKSCCRRCGETEPIYEEAGNLKWEESRADSVQGLKRLQTGGNARTP